MKKHRPNAAIFKWLRISLFLLFLTLLFSPVFAHQSESAVDADRQIAAVSTESKTMPNTQDTGIARLAADTNGLAQVHVNATTGVADFVTLPQADMSASLRLSSERSAKSEAVAFLDRYGDAFGIDNANGQLLLLDERRDFAGQTHLTYKQVYQGVDVFAGILRIHLNDRGLVTAVNGTFLPRVAVNANPTLTADAAADIAVNAILSQNELLYSSSDVSARNHHLYIFQTGLLQGVTGSIHLVYELEVANADQTIREFVYVDAHKGQIVDQITGTHEDLEREISEVTLENLVWEEGDPYPIPSGWAGGTAQQVTDWQNEIDGAGETYNLFASMTGGTYLSYDGADAVMRTLNNDPGINCPNANWNGTSTNYCSGVTGDDTVAHEWGHAYTEYTNNLVYQWQSGALNESYSDIWGETVDLINGRGTDAPDLVRSSNYCSSNVAGANFSSHPTIDTVRWLSGEDDPAFNNIPSGSGNAIRDMWDPTCFGDPGKVTDTNQYVCTTADSGGVHTNSGIPNHAFALMVDGGTYNGQTITALGLTKAAHIHWAAQNMLTPGSDFVAHANALEASCNALIGVDLPALSTDSTTTGSSGEMITVADCQEVANVNAAVEFRTEPSFCGFDVLLDPDAPPLCEGVGDVQTIAFEDWESGLPSGWSVGTHDVANPSTFDTPNWDVVGNLPAGAPAGSTMAAFVADLAIGNCSTDDESGALYLDSPEITVPAGTPITHVAFDHWVATELGWDGGNLKVSVNGGPFNVVPTSSFDFNPYNQNINSAGAGNTNPLAGQPGFTGTNGGTINGSWGQSQVNLEGIAFAGDTVQFRFDFGIDGCNGVIGWYVDNVQTYSCSEEVGSPFIEVDPDALSTRLAPDHTTDDTLTIVNRGGSDLEWSIAEDTQPPALLQAVGESVIEAPGAIDKAQATHELSADVAFNVAGLTTLESTPDVVEPGIATITHSASQTIMAGNSVWCPAAPGNRYLRVFDMVNEFDITSSFNVTEVEVGIQTAVSTGGSQNITVNLYTLNGALLYGNMTLIGSANVSIVDQALSKVTVPVTGSVPPGGVLVAEVYAPANNVTAAFLIGSNNMGQTAPSYLAAPACGITQPTPFAAIGFSGVHIVMNVTGEVGDDFLTCTNPMDISWASVSPASGTTAAESSSDVTVTYDATGLTPGIYEGTLCVESNAINTSLIQVPLTLEVAVPDCSGAYASVSSLWPANHKFKNVNVLGVTDPDGGSDVTITIDSIYQDEAVNAPFSGNTAPDGQGIGTATAQVRAERVSAEGNGNGRVYHIGFTAEDNFGGMCSGEVLVGVPMSNNGTPAVDDGALFDSTAIP